VVATPNDQVVVVEPAEVDGPDRAAVNHRRNRRGSDGDSRDRRIIAGVNYFSVIAARDS
jgi:hypothetical protein